MENARVLKFACRLLADCAEPENPGEAGGGGAKRGTFTVFTRDNRNSMSAAQAWNSKYPQNKAI